MHFRGSPVDLICEEEIGEDGTQRSGEVAGLLVVDACSHQIRRDEIRSELNSSERPANGSGKSLDRKGLGEPRHALDEEVSLREHRDQHPLQETILADDDFLHFVEDALHE